MHTNEYGQWKLAGKWNLFPAEGVTLSGVCFTDRDSNADGVLENPALGAEGARARLLRLISQAKGQNFYLLCIHIIFMSARCIICFQDAFRRPFLLAEFK